MAALAAKTPTALSGVSVWLRAIARGRRGQAGLLLIGLPLAVALFGPFVAPYSPYAIAVGEPVTGPTASHLLGTDILGRDVLSRLLNGGRSVILLPSLAVLIAAMIGASSGLWSGFKGGIADDLVTRVVDVLISVPPLLIGMVLILPLGSSPIVLVGIVILFFAPRIFRVIRGATQALVGEDYVFAARARGESTRAILAREILPNITGPLIAELGIRFSVAIIFIATLNFLGLGVQPPSPDWGLMVSENRVILAEAPLAALAPILCIASIAIGANLMADQVAMRLARNVRRDARL